MDINFDAIDSGILATFNETSSKNFKEISSSTHNSRTISNQINYSFKDSQDDFEKVLSSQSHKSKEPFGDYHAVDQSFNFDTSVKNTNKIVFFTESSESESYSRASSPSGNSGIFEQNHQFNKGQGVGGKMTESIQLGLQDLLLQRKFLEEQRRKFNEMNRKKNYTQA